MKTLLVHHSNLCEMYTINSAITYDNLSIRASLGFEIALGLLLLANKRNLHSRRVLAQTIIKVNTAR